MFRDFLFPSVLWFGIIISHRCKQNNLFIIIRKFIKPFRLQLYQDNASLEYLVYNIFYINRLVFLVLSQNIGESPSSSYPWYICFNTHSISGNSLCYFWASMIAKPQLYFSKLFYHIGLEAYIPVHSSLILGI